MRYSVDDFVGSISLEQRDELDKTLQAGERILWATRPRLSSWPCSGTGLSGERHVGIVLVSFFMAMCSKELACAVPMFWQALLEVSEGQGSLLRLVLLTVILAILITALYISTRFFLFLAMQIFALRRKRRHTLYILTNQRTITIAPEFTGWKTDSYSLDEDMIMERRQSRAGGELIFRLKTDGRRGSGWTALPDRDLAEKQIQAALAARG